MAITITHEGSEWNAELYDKTIERVIPDPNNLPQGMLCHIASPAEPGWRVVDAWESEADWERFRDETLIPAVQEMDMPPFDSKVSEAHNVMK